jgi:predicted RND superfamily exporter protein
MGYFGIPLKPSTILVFSIVLTSVDTIHFLAQYRQELTNNDWKICFATIKESGISMFTLR